LVAAWCGRVDVAHELLSAPYNGGTIEDYAQVVNQRNEVS